MVTPPVTPQPRPARRMLLFLTLLAALALAPTAAYRASAQTTAPLIQILGAGQLIASGDTTPAPADGTDLGTVRVGGTLTSTFSVVNAGDADLVLTGTPVVTVTGSADFSVIQQATTPIISGGSAPFTVQFLPTATGTQTATVSITSNAAASPYTFVVQGNGFVGPAISLDVTVGPVASGCSSSDSLRVAPGTTVTYCYLVINTGTVALTRADLTDTVYGAILTDAEITLAPQAAYFHLVDRVVTVTTTSTATWTSYNPGPTDQASDSDSATVTAEFEAPAFTSGAPGDGVYGAGYTFTFEATGLPPPTFAVTAGSLPPGLSLGATGVLTGTATAAGSYTFAVTASNGVAPEATQEVTLTIARAPLTITADDKAMRVGEEPPPLTASYSGLVNGDTPASLDTAPTLSTTATSASPPGAYPIVVSGAADANYTISYVAGTLTVGRTTIHLPLLGR